MTIEEINLLFESASKVLHLDKSHDAIRTNIQAALSAQHRKDNAASDSSSYYNTPYVRDVFGTEDAGQVVHSKDGKMTLSKYKKDSKSNYNLSDHKPVKHAYVVDDETKKESMCLIMDGKELEVKESNAPVILSEVLDLQEADAKSASAKITLITAGKGSMGFYTESGLKKAAKDGIFNGVQMFLNHQTSDERRTRPEGDITKLVGKVGKVEYVEGIGGKPGRLVSSNTKIYPEYSSFIASRKDDIGLSVRVGAENSGKMQEGVPLVENMLYALSTDFVTKAGRGGKIEELYESYREQHPAQSSGNQPQENQEMTDEEKGLFTKLQESIVALTASNAARDVKIDRLMERNESFSASAVISESLVNCGLSPRGQVRVRDFIMANLPLNDDKSLNVTKLKESVAAAVTDEKAYLQESGVAPRTSPVRYLGNGGISLINEADDKPRSDAEILSEADKMLDESVDSIMGKETKKSA